jgi:hypothetical protein
LVAQLFVGLKPKVIVGALLINFSKEATKVINFTN